MKDLYLRPCRTAASWRRHLDGPKVSLSIRQVHVKCANFPLPWKCFKADGPFHLSYDYLILLSTFIVSLVNELVCLNAI